MNLMVVMIMGLSTFMITVRKLYHPETLKYCWELWIGWRSFKLTGFWFTDKIGA